MATGLLQSRQPSSGALKRIAEEIEKKVTPELRRTHDAIVVAGMKLMWGSEQTHQMMVEYLQKVKQNPAELVKLVSHGIIKLISVILRESQIPKDEFMGPSASAAIILMTQALDYLQKRLGVPVDQQTISQVTKAIGQGLFELYEVTPEQIDQAMTQQQQGQQEPRGAPSSPLPAAGPPRAPGGM